jgi:hypothetical protein
VREELLREAVVKRIGMPKREHKVIPTLSPAQLDRLFAACAQGETPEVVARTSHDLIELDDPREADEAGDTHFG